MTNSCVIAGRRKTPPKPSGMSAKWLDAGLPRAFQLLAMTALLLAFAAPPARAACTDPAGAEGQIVYNGDQNVPQFCDGSDWIALARRVEINSLLGPSGCEDIGDLCADGTVFAGYHPITQEHLFIPTTDQGTTSAWKTSTGTNDIATDSTYDGRANTNQVANSATFPAFKLCKDLTTGGHSDWYLPSRVEAYYLWLVRGTIEAGGNITNFQTAYYWSSTEYSTSGAWFQYFPYGLQDTATKTGLYRVRCVRR